MIYFNVVHSIKHILATLETWDDSLDDDDTPDDAQSLATSKLKKGNGIADQPSPSNSLMDSSVMQNSPGSAAHSAAGSGHSIPSKESGAHQIANLRRRLAHLIAMDEQLADRLSGGITVSGSGKGSVYVRSGWQARTIENALGKKKPKHSSEKTRESASQDAPPDPLVQQVAGFLQACAEDIHELWSHPTVKGMILKRRLKLDEWSELCVFQLFVGLPSFKPSLQLFATYFTGCFAGLCSDNG